MYTHLDLSGTSNVLLPNSFSQELLHSYASKVDFSLKLDPWAESLRHQIAKLHSLTMNQVCVGVGSSQVLDALLRSMPERRIIDVIPNFHMARTVAIRDRRPYRGVLVRNPFDLLPALSSELQSDGIIILSSPRNPFGYAFAPSDIEQLLQNHSGVLILDRAYGDFDEWDPIPLLDHYSNLFIVSTFSKAWGLAGLRVGYALSSSFAQSFYEAYLLRYSIGTLSLGIAGAALQAAPVVLAAIERLRAARHQLLSQCNVLRNTTIWSSDASFVCIEYPHSQNLSDSLQRIGLRVACLSKLPGYPSDWPDGIRVAIPPPEVIPHLVSHLLEEIYE